MIPAPAHLQALFDAYVEVTGRQLTLSHPRRQTLREFDRRGFTPADVRWVLGELSRRVRTGVKGYSEASLDWANAMSNADRFEERLALLKQARAKRQEKADAEKKDIKDQDAAMLEALESPAIRQRMAAQAKRLAEELRAKLYGGQP